MIATRLKKIALTLKLRVQLCARLGLFAVRGLRVRKIEERSIVVTGSYKGQRVIFKQYPRDKAAARAEKACAELRFLETNLPEPYHVNNCIESLPDLGVVILKWVDGDTVRSLYNQAEERERGAIVLQVAGWLKACADLRSKEKPLRAAHFVARLDVADNDTLTSEERALLNAMLAEMAALAEGIEAKPVIHTSAHDDMTLVNLKIWNGELYAIDINKERWLPLMRMAARFLVMKDFFSPCDGQELFHGLTAAEARMFLKHAGVALRQKRVVRYFIAEQMVRVYVARESDAEKQKCARQRMRAFLGKLPETRAGQGLASSV
ncbi:phosphotransferase [Neptunicoccus cionae]|uniref:Aminoglycoside phosphotransferase domain-containing protein n=1 Tax=Neptunicoccus cionae TaxID=2035344 RepID=A0A916VRK3_9RHOB|nr:phosphotransferase [Amylibacter cionae]GGA24621.1 hypothetical protein GCM10011498_27050 [Amylibacter cionae]